MQSGAKINARRARTREAEAAGEICRQDKSVPARRDGRHTSGCNAGEDAIEKKRSRSRGTRSK